MSFKARKDESHNPKKRKKRKKKRLMKSREKLTSLPAAYQKEKEINRFSTSVYAYALPPLCPAHSRFKHTAPAG
jgi:hypothetical protein